MGHGEPLDRVDSMVHLGPLGLQELQPRGRRVEQITHLDPGAVAQRRRLNLMHPTTLNVNLPAIGPGHARGDAQTADRADGRQRLTSEPQRGNMRQFVVRQFRRRMALDGQAEFFRRHAGTVIAH